MILFETPLGSKTLTQVPDVEALEALLGFPPVMRNVACSCARTEEGCLKCCLDAEATAAKAGLSLDVGDKYDTYQFSFDSAEGGQGAGWPSRTGNPSGGGRANTPRTDGGDWRRRQ